MDAAPNANTGAVESTRPGRNGKHHKKHKRSHGEKSSTSKESGKAPEANVDTAPPKQAQSDGEAQGQSDVGPSAATVVGDPSCTAQPVASPLSSASPLPAAAPSVAPAVAPGVAPLPAPALSSSDGPAVGSTVGASIASAVAPAPDPASAPVPEGAPALPATQQIGLKRPPDANVDSAPPKPTQAVGEAQGQSDVGLLTATVTATGAGGPPTTVTQRATSLLSAESSRLPGAASAAARPPLLARRISEQAPAFPATEQRSPKSVIVPAAVAVAVVLFLATVVVGSMIWGATAVAPSTTSVVSSKSGTSDEYDASVGPDISCPTILNISSEAAVAATTAGILVGSSVTAGEANLSRWLGVPYAQSTEGGRRFAKPEPLNASDRCAVMETVVASPPCAQWGRGAEVVGDEDCLRMNIWAPAERAPGEAKRGLVLAAAVHWFQTGTNDVPQWEELAGRAGVVVMSPNVRLGVLGFLHPRAKGIVRDVAEEDTMAALRWAQDNAAAFGADPSALMLVGNGTGGYLLVQAAGRLNVTVVRAVLEGSVYRSAVPANTASSAVTVKWGDSTGLRL
ncbi:uncharacterized protein LOC144129683 [Amblyomma americanum]